MFGSDLKFCVDLKCCCVDLKYCCVDLKCFYFNRIEHDNTGFAPGWYLEKVYIVLSNLKGIWMWEIFVNHHHKYHHHQYHHRYHYHHNHHHHRLNVFVQDAFQKVGRRARVDFLESLIEWLQKVGPQNIVNHRNNIFS